MTARSKRIVSAVFATAYALLFSLRQGNVIPPRWHALADWGLGAIMIISAMLLPAIAGDGAPALAETAEKLGKVAVLVLLTFTSCAHRPGGHYVLRPPDAVACALALPRVAAAQLPCDRKKPDPAACVFGALAAVVAGIPCMPSQVWVADPAPAADAGDEG